MIVAAQWWEWTILFAALILLFLVVTASVTVLPYWSVYGWPKLRRKGRRR